MSKTKSKSIYTQEMKLLHKNVPLLFISSPEINCPLRREFWTSRVSNERMKFQLLTLGTLRKTQKINTPLLLSLASLPVHKGQREFVMKGNPFKVMSP